ncbi:MAG: hypothetical protein QM622_10440 [Microbacterium sp.]
MPIFEVNVHPIRKDISYVKASHGLVPVFDDHKLVSHAGLSPVLGLAEKAGLVEVIEDSLTVSATNIDVKARTVLATMLAGAGSIDDLDLLRTGGPGGRGGARAVDDRDVPALVRPRACRPVR